MIHKPDKCIALALVLLAALVACTPAKRPFQMVQFCLSDERDLADFKRELELIAQTEGMRFVDRSAESKRELERIAAMKGEKTVLNPFINVGVLGDDGLGLGAGNLGLPGYQVAVGFSEGSSPGEARRFAQMVIRRLENHWNVKLVPSGTGAEPLTDCS